MRKISLKNLNIQEVEPLSRNQLKDVLGGYTTAGKVSCIPGVNICNSDCPCRDAADWCVNGLCQKR